MIMRISSEKFVECISNVFCCHYARIFCTETCVQGVSVNTRISTYVVATIGYDRYDTFVSWVVTHGEDACNLGLELVELDPENQDMYPTTCPPQTIMPAVGAVCAQCQPGFKCSLRVRLCRICRACVCMYACVGLGLLVPAHLAKACIFSYDDLDVI
jgi:hypothetical protein